MRGPTRIARQGGCRTECRFGLSIEAIKKRWMSIFDRVDEFKPDSLSSSGEDSDVRGPKKRHRVLLTYGRIRKNCGLIPGTSEVVVYCAT
jgi:hypothetical protein